LETPSFEAEDGFDGSLDEGELRIGDAVDGARTGIWL
jgi:hypothetical protein